MQASIFILEEYNRDTNASKCDISDIMKNQFLVTSNDWLELGVATIPVRAKSKKPAIAWHTYNDRLPTAFELQAWWGRPGYGLAVVAGWRNLMVVDFDDRIKWAQWLAGLDIVRAVAALSTYRVNTRQGVHLYFWSDEEPRNSVIGTHELGFDVRGKNGYVLAPPTIHPTGVPYSAVGTPAAIQSVPGLRWLFPELPARQEQRAVIRADGDLFTEAMSDNGNGNGTSEHYARVALENEARAVASALQGRRNHTLVKAAFCLGQLVATGALDAQDVRATLGGAASQCGLHRHEIVATIESGLRDGVKSPRSGRRSRSGGG